MSRTLIPNSFQVENLYVDELLCFLKPNEWLVLSVAIREIIGWHDTIADRRRRISLSTFIDGKGGGRHSHGIWLGRAAVVRALQALNKYHILIKEGKGNHPNGQLFYLQEDADQIDWNGLEARRVQTTKERRQQTKKARAIRTDDKDTSLLDRPVPVSETDRSQSVKQTHGNPLRNPPLETPAPSATGEEHTGQHDDPFPGLEAYKDKNRWGYTVRQVEEGEPEFRCPACDTTQPWPLKTPYGGLTCAKPECNVPLAGYRPHDAQPFWKPPKLPVEKHELGVLVPGCPKHFADIPYFEQDKKRLLHAMRKDHQRLWTLIEWAWAKPLLPHKIVANALEAFYNPKTVVARAIREATKNAKRNPAAGNGQKPPSIVAAHDF
ncbi:MAG: hypothetical protein GWN58_27900 [Anaerolineae bacterium]|nr:hypothetical protein [Anaerolineae bacterium]